MTRIRRISASVAACLLLSPQTSQASTLLNRRHRERTALTTVRTSMRANVPIRSWPHGDSAAETKSDASASIGRPLGVLRSSGLLFFIGTALVAFSPAHALVTELGTERATSTLSALTASAALSQIVLSPALGSTLDSAGRKPVVLAAILAVAVSHALVSLNPSVVSICAAKVVGIFSIGLFFIASQAIVSDVASENPEQMSSAIGLTMATTSVGFLVGTVLAGRLADLGLSIKYGMSSVLAALAAALVALHMPETLLESNQIPWEGKKLLQSPWSCTRILFRHGSKVRILAILLMLMTLPINMGDFFQIYAKTEWDVTTKEFSSFVSLFVVLGIVSQTTGSFLVSKLGIKRFTAMTTLSSICGPFGAAFFGFRGLSIGALVGFLGAASTLGITAALVSEGAKSHVPQGELAGERSAILGLLKVIGPVWYSTLYVQGRKWWGLNNLPFLFNIGLALLAFAISQMHL